MRVDFTRVYPSNEGAEELAADIVERELVLVGFLQLSMIRSLEVIGVLAQ